MINFGLSSILLNRKIIGTNRRIISTNNTLLGVGGASDKTKEEKKLKVKESLWFKVKRFFVEKKR